LRTFREYQQLPFHSEFFCASFRFKLRGWRRPLSFRKFLLVLGLVIVLQACHNTEDPVEVKSQPRGDSLSALAVTDLASRLGIPRADIEVLAEENVTWRDGSLGCPKPGMMYTQALVEGSRIVLRAGGRDYSYHSGAGKPPFYCEDPVSPASGPSAE
jgi:hypothetical protein